MTLLDLAESRGLSPEAVAHLQYRYPLRGYVISEVGPVYMADKSKVIVADHRKMNVRELSSKHNEFTRVLHERVRLVMGERY